MPMFRKIPVEVEAWQWDGVSTSPERPEWLRGPDVTADHFETVLLIQTLEGKMIATKGDWIIKGVKGEIYPCKPDIFAKTYQPVDRQPRNWDGTPTTLEAMDAEMGFDRLRSMFKEAHEYFGRLDMEYEASRPPIMACVGDFDDVDVADMRSPGHVTFVSEDQADFGEAIDPDNGKAISPDDPAHPEQRYGRFEEVITGAINGCSMEGGSDTPDFILAKFLVGVLRGFNELMQARDKWWGGSHQQLKARLEAEGEHTAAANAQIDRLNTEIERVTRRQQGPLMGKD